MNYSVYDKLLWIHIATIIISMALFYGLIILLFSILKWCRLVSNQKAFRQGILMMGAFFLVVSAIMSFPAFLDICKDSYCVQKDITSIHLATERASSRRLNINHTLICETKSGEIYEYYDYLYSFEHIEEILENNCIVYGKHSRIVLDWVKTG